MSTIKKIFTDTLGGRSTSEYIGSKGELVYDVETGATTLSNGLTPGGAAIGVQLDGNVVAAAKENYENSLATWNQMLTMEQYREGHPWFKWNVNGETAQYYYNELQNGWTAQNTPSSPPTLASELPFLPPISAAYYAQLRVALQLVINAYAAYVASLENKQITGDSLTIPEILQTTAEEDLVVRLRTAVPSSPPGNTAYMTRDFTYGVNGTLTFPNGTTQTGAAISKEELKQIVANSADFAAFKAAISIL